MLTHAVIGEQIPDTVLRPRICSAGLTRNDRQNSAFFIFFSGIISQIEFGTRLGYLWLLLGTPGDRDLNF
jgi:hypothetical protein